MGIDRGVSWPLIYSHLYYQKSVNVPEQAQNSKEGVQSND